MKKEKTKNKDIIVDEILMQTGNIIQLVDALTSKAIPKTKKKKIIEKLRADFILTSQSLSIAIGFIEKKNLLSKLMEYQKDINKKVVDKIGKTE